MQRRFYGPPAIGTLAEYLPANLKADATYLSGAVR
jgi:hypothetical protein